MGVVKGVLLLILGASLYVASLVAVPVEEVRVEGLRHLSREAVLQTLRLAPGDPWLWVWGNRLRPLLENPWVAEAHLEKPALGQVVVRVRERRPFLPLETGDALAEDGVLLSLGRAFPQAREIRYTPAGFWVELEGATLFAPEAAYLLKYAQTARPKGRVFVYSWGVSQRP